MKSIITIALIAFAAITVNAQNFGFTFSRGASGIYPNHHQFNQTHSQGVSLGIHHAAKLKYKLNLQTGLNVSALSSVNSITTRGNSVVRVPGMFYYVDVPFLIERRLELTGKSKTSPYLMLKGGVNAAFLWHDKSFAESPDIAEGRNPVNPGLTFSAMYAIPQTKKTTFAVGPMVKMLGTGGNFSRAAAFYAIRLDWRFSS